MSSDPNVVPNVTDMQSLIDVLGHQPVPSLQCAFLVLESRKRLNLWFFMKEKTIAEWSLDHFSSSLERTVKGNLKLGYLQEVCRS